MSKEKSHRFVVVVKTNEKRGRAELALLSCFAKRQPDGCEFNLLKRSPKR